jgi:hypothetical protein
LVHSLVAMAWLAMGASGPAGAAELSVEAGPGVTGIVTPGQAWLMGVEMSWGVVRRPRATEQERSLLRTRKLGDLLVGQEWGLGLHTRFLAGRIDRGRRGAQVMLGLEPRLSFYRDPRNCIVIYRMVSVLGALIPEPGAALDAAGVHPFVSWSLPFSFYSYDEVAPTVIWMSPLSGRTTLLFGLSLRMP